MSWGHSRHSKEDACRITLLYGTQILIHRAMNILSEDASTQGPKGQCTSRVPACPTLPSWPTMTTEPDRTSPQAAPLLPPPCSLSWVCVLLEHNPALMDMTGSNTRLPTQPIPINRVDVAAICQEHPTARGSPHPTSSQQNHFLRCHSGKHNLWHSPGPQGSSFKSVLHNTH